MAIHGAGISIVIVGWKWGRPISQLVHPVLQYHENKNFSRDVYTLLKRIFRGDLGLDAEWTNRMYYV
jgi:hypothetical protein